MSYGIRSISYRAAASRAHRCPGCCAHPGTPCGRGDTPAPASVGFAALALVDERCEPRRCVRPHFSRASYFLTRFFYPMRLRSLDSGRLFSAKIAFRYRPYATFAKRAILRNLFRRPCANFYVRAGLRLRRAPQRAARPLIPGRAKSPAPADLQWENRRFRRNPFLLKHII